MHFDFTYYYFNMVDVIATKFFFSIITNFLIEFYFFLWGVFFLTQFVIHIGKFSLVLR